MLPLGEGAILPWLTMIIVTISHAWFLLPFARKLSQSEIPSPVDFVGLSAVIYFDSGLIFEAAGLRYQNPFFFSLFQAKPGTVITAVLLMAGAPWLIRLSAGRVSGYRPDDLGRLRGGTRRRLFYAASSLICVACAGVPLALAHIGAPLWETRYVLGKLMGPRILVLSVPMCLLAFYLRTGEAKTGRGKLFSTFLLVSAVASTFALGQRTMILLPCLMFVVFGMQISLRRWVGVGVAGALAAALLLPFFKPSHGNGFKDGDNLFADTLNSDFYRAPELRKSVEMSAAVGTRLFGSMGSGYTYSALLFVPRALVPMKGISSASVFTSRVMQVAPETLSWGFGISAVSEALLNFGILLAPVALVGLGVGIGWATRKSREWRSLQIPLCFGCAWIFGYHLPALLALFGMMALTGLAAEAFFVARNATCSAEVEE